MRVREIGVVDRRRFGISGLHPLKDILKKVEIYYNLIEKDLLKIF